MLEAKIYITIDNCSPKSTKKHYGYVMECMVFGVPKTREGFGEITGTYHHATLTAIVEALSRFKKPCEITICTEDEYVLSMLELNLGTWADNGFLNSKGKPVASQKEWMDLWLLSRAHLLLTFPGKHQYSAWIRGELERRKKEEK